MVTAATAKNVYDQGLTTVRLARADQILLTLSVTVTATCTRRPVSFYQNNYGPWHTLSTLEQSSQTWMQEQNCTPLVRYYDHRVGWHGHDSVLGGKLQFSCFSVATKHDEWLMLHASWQTDACSINFGGPSTGPATRCGLSAKRLL